MRTAVVIIHGIGEQKPMSTLRGFVTSLTSESKSSQQIKFYSKPDQLSNLFELRRLTTSASQEDGREKTDFFEYYWAYNLRDTKIGEVISWMKNIVLRWPWTLPSRIRGVQLFVWTILIAFTSFALFAYQQHWLDSKWPAWLGLLLSLLVTYRNFILTKYVGDAARYTSAEPGNIKERQKIRQEGILLLRSLHECKKYEKIIIVGHSLGSIIGYDIIRHLWVEYHEKYMDTKFASDLLKFESKYADSATGNFDLTEFKHDQEALFYQQNSDGNPWRISHFITMGSPLTHASFLLAKDEHELKQRIKERELPVTPPEYEERNNKKTITYQPDLRKSRRILHFGAPFACTQWINVYYKNDLVGGNLAQHFGPGIEEHKIEYKGSLAVRKIPFLSHTHYWEEDPRDIVKCESSLTILKRYIWS